MNNGFFCLILRQAGGFNEKSFLRTTLKTNSDVKCKMLTFQKYKPAVQFMYTENHMMMKLLFFNQLNILKVFFYIIYTFYIYRNKYIVIY